VIFNDWEYSNVNWDQFSSQKMDENDENNLEEAQSSQNGISEEKDEKDSKIALAPLPAFFIQQLAAKCEEQQFCQNEEREEEAEMAAPKLAKEGGGEEFNNEDEEDENGIKKEEENEEAKSPDLQKQGHSPPSTFSSSMAMTTNGLIGVNNIVGNGTPGHEATLDGENPLEKIQRIFSAADSPPPHSLAASNAYSLLAPLNRPPHAKHQCRWCMKGFSSSSALQIHTRTHTGTNINRGYAPELWLFIHQELNQF
jgi:hypothetical protein